LMMNVRVLVWLAGVAALAAGLPSAVAGVRPSGDRVFESVLLPGDQLWVSRYNGAGNGADAANDVGVSPDGSKVFVTGMSVGSGTGDDYATAAYDSATGAQLWVQRYGAGGDDVPVGLSVSPDGTRLFVAGTDGDSNFATIAYDTATGAQLWVEILDGGFEDGARDVAVSPDGSRVFVTGWSSRESGFLFSTVAYDAATGGQLWWTRYNGLRGPGSAVALGVSPDNSTVFVTGENRGTIGLWRTPQLLACCSGGRTIADRAAAKTAPRL
jgi:DNA-binding beta-propeller fold protein YncE